MPQTIYSFSWVIRLHNRIGCSYGSLKTDFWQDWKRKKSKLYGLICVVHEKHEKLTERCIRQVDPLCPALGTGSARRDCDRRYGERGREAKGREGRGAGALSSCFSSCEEICGKQELVTEQLVTN